MACNSCNNNLNEYGTFKTLKERPNLLTFIMFWVPSKLSTNFTGPSDCGLKNKFLDSLNMASDPVVLQTAI